MGSFMYSQNAVPTMNGSAGLPDQEGIIPIEDYARLFMDTVKLKYEEMIKIYEKHDDLIAEKDKYFKVESQLLMTKIQRFLSYMLSEA